MNISDLMQELIHDFEDDLSELLNYEMEINEKKIKGIPLTQDEFIFDTYFIKPSTIARTILKREKK